SSLAITPIPGGKGKPRADSEAEERRRTKPAPAGNACGEYGGLQHGRENARVCPRRGSEAARVARRFGGFVLPSRRERESEEHPGRIAQSSSRNSRSTGRRANRRPKRRLYDR